MRSSPCIVLLLVLAACGGREREAAVPSAPPAAPTPKAPSAPPPPAASAAGGIQWDVSAPLVRREPKSPVRAAEYGIDAEPRAELVVFHFGDEKVSVEGQIQGWLIQMEQPDGTETAKRAKRAEFKVGPLTVNTVEVTGTYTGPVAMPGVQLDPDHDWTLLGAIVSGHRGPVMFKLTGPGASVERARSAFDQLLHSVRVGDVPH